MEYTTLKNGVKMPLLGFGVFQVPEGEVCEESVYNALTAGYRLIDTAAVYGNELWAGLSGAAAFPVRNCLSPSCGSRIRGMRPRKRP